MTILHKSQIKSHLIILNVANTKNNNRNGDKVMHAHKINKIFQVVHYLTGNRSYNLFTQRWMQMQIPVLKWQKPQDL